jgi:hypothetical protein
LSGFGCVDQITDDDDDDDSYIWPVGYTSKRRMPCWHDGETPVYYTNEICDGGDAPVFKVTHPDGTSMTHHASSGVWKAALEK